MPDFLDETEERIEAERTASLERIRQNAAAIVVGTPGECDRCGEHSPRLVNGVCAPCRDKYKLK